MPIVPLVTARNLDSLAAVHAQPGTVVTATCCAPAVHSTSRRSGVTMNAHGTSAVTRALRATLPPSTTAATWQMQALPDCTPAST